MKGSYGFGVKFYSSIEMEKKMMGLDRNECVSCMLQREMGLVEILFGFDNKFILLYNFRKDSFEGQFFL